MYTFGRGGEENIEPVERFVLSCSVVSFWTGLLEEEHGLFGEEMTNGKF